MKRVIIVGATSGIGRALAILYSSRGYEVGITGRREELLKSLSAELRTKTYPLKSDIADTGKAIDAFENLVRDMNGVDIVIISSGTGHHNEPLEWSREKETIETNVLGFTAIADAAMRFFLKRGSGHLVGISSIAALRGSRIAPAYNASKAFVSNYLEGLRLKASNTGNPIFVTDIRPGFVDTAMAKGDGLFWVASPGKAAEQIFAAIEKKRKVAYITRRWTILAWIMKVLPDFLYQKF